MNILVTGGSGFIGSHLVDGLAHAGHRVISLDRVPRGFEALPLGAEFIEGDFGEAGDILAGEGIEVVYHTAWASIHETSNADPAADIAANLIPTVRLLDQCRNAGVRRFVFLSSGGQVYGLPAKLPVPEDHPTHPISGYGITKLAAEKYLLMFARQYGMEPVIFRPSVPYGPRQNPHRRQGAVSVFIHRALNNLPVEIWGDGGGVRDYFYIDDLTRALVQAADSPDIAGKTINLAGARVYSLNELLQAIREALGREIQVSYQPSRNFDVPSLELDTSLARSLLGWRPETDLPAGIRRMADWMLKWKL